MGLVSKRYYGSSIKARVGDPVKVLLREIKRYYVRTGRGVVSESDIVRIGIIRYGRELLGEEADFILSKGKRRNGK